MREDRKSAGPERIHRCRQRGRKMVDSHLAPVMFYPRIDVLRVGTILITDSLLYLGDTSVMLLLMADFHERGENGPRR